MSEDLSLSTKSSFPPVARNDCLVICDCRQITAIELREIAQLLAEIYPTRLITIGPIPSLIEEFQGAGHKLVSASISRAHSLEIQEETVWLETDENELSDPGWAQTLLQDWFITYSKVLLNCDPGDSWLKRALHQTKLTVGNMIPPGRLIFAGAVSEGYQRFLETHEIRIVQMKITDWLHSWKDEATVSETIHSGRTSSIRHEPLEPYLFLDSFGVQDAARFFGRDREIRALGEFALSSQFTILYGSSGTGKSSLLAAGLMSVLSQMDVAGFYARISNDKLWGMGNSSCSKGGLEQIRNDTKSIDFSQYLMSLTSMTDQLIVVILDQFEELFTSFGGNAPSRFGADLAQAIVQTAGRIHFVFALREDYLSRLNDLRVDIPRIFDRSLRLKPLAPEQAYEAITRPARENGYSFETGLAYAMLNDLRRTDGLIIPADLQIVCHSLYLDLQREREELFSFQQYQRMGGAHKILQDYLEQTLEREDCPAHTRTVIKSLITSQGTRIQATLQDIAAGCALPEQSVKHALNWLEAPHRLIRKIRREGHETSYELSHEILAPKILDWIKDPVELRAKTIKDIIIVETQNYKSFGILPGAAKIQLIDQEKGNPFLHLAGEETNLLARAALNHGIHPDHWLRLIPPAQAELFQRQALTNPSREIRRHALNTMTVEQALAELKRTVGEEKVENRIIGLQTLAWLPKEIAWPVLCQARLDSVDSIKKTAWGLLYELDSRKAQDLLEKDQFKFHATGSWLTCLILAQFFTHWGGKFDFERIGIFMILLILLSGISRLALKLTGAARHATTGILTAIPLILVLKGWGILPIVLVVLGLRGNLSLLLITSAGFLPLLMNSRGYNLESVLITFGTNVAIFSTLGLTIFRRFFSKSGHLVSRNLLVTWIIAGLLYTFKIGWYSNLPALATLVSGGTTFWYLATRLSINPSQPRGLLTPVVLYLQKSWDVIEQISPYFRPALGWLLGNLIALLLILMGAREPATAGILQEIPKLAGVNLGLVIATWPLSNKTMNYLKALLLGGISGAIFGGLAWAIMAVMVGIMQVQLADRNHAVA